MKKYFYILFALIFMLTTSIKAQESTNLDSLEDNLDTLLLYFLEKYPKWQDTPEEIHNLDGTINNIVLQEFSNDFCIFVFNEGMQDVSPTLKKLMKKEIIALCMVIVETAILEENNQEK